MSASYNITDQIFVCNYSGCQVHRSGFAVENSLFFIFSRIDES